uniref:hypothetical protein n=1 Tax=Candidatus Scatousia sp. TaxID=3085663 RepID=UPI00402A1834
MIKSVNLINFKGTNLAANAKEQPKQETAAAVTEQPQASGSEAIANYNKAAFHPSQQIKPQVETEPQKTEGETKPQEKDNDKDEKDD